MAFCVCSFESIYWVPPTLPPITAVRCKECKEVSTRCWRCAHFVCPQKHVVVEHGATQSHLEIPCSVCCHESFVHESNQRGAVDIVTSHVVNTTEKVTVQKEEATHEEATSVWMYE